MRLIVFLILVGISTYGGPPEFDLRNTQVVDTNTPFFKTVFAGWPNFRTVRDWEQRQAVLRRQILISAGLYPLPRRRAPPRVEITHRQTYDGFTVANALIETRPGYWLGANIYRPTQPSRQKMPAILSPHGHWKHGRLEQTDQVNVPARCITLARMGFLVIAYDMVGYGDTRQTPHAFGNEREQLWLWGPLGLQLWNSIRVVDYLQSLQEVDARRLGATGASGGATQTILLSAVDDRIRYSAPVNMVSNVMQGGSPCENAPGLRVETFNVEIAAMMAPRPMLLVSATGDWTKTLPKQEFPAIRRIYALLGKESEVESAQVDAEHNYNKASRELVYDFFARKMLGQSHGPAEGPIPELKREDLLVLNSHSLPAGSADYDALYGSFRREWAAYSATLPEAAKRSRLRHVLLAEWPQRVEAEVSGAKVLLYRDGRGDRVPGRLAGGQGSPVIVVSPHGGEDAARQQPVKDLIAAGRRVLLLDVFQTGSARAPRDEYARYYTTFQRSDAANRVADIFTALRWFEQEGQKAELLGLDSAAVWTAVASAAAPAAVKVLRMPGNFTGSADSDDAEWMKTFNAPGIQWAGGWNSIRELVR